MYTDANGVNQFGMAPEVDKAAARRMRGWMNYKPPTQFGFQMAPMPSSGIGGSAPDFMAPPQQRAEAGGYSLGPGGQPMNGPDAVNVDLMKPDWKVQTEQGAGVRPGAVPAMNAVQQARQSMGQNPDAGIGGSQPPWATDPSKAALAGYR